MSDDRHFIIGPELSELKGQFSESFRMEVNINCFWVNDISILCPFDGFSRA